MPLLTTTRLSECDIVRMHPLGARQKKFFSLSNLPDCLNNDPDLARLSSEERLQALQTLFIATGCDYVSFFAGIGKISFLKVFYRHASFITGRTHPGSLTDTGPETRDQGFLAFLRLVGAPYLNKYSTCFTHTSPDSHFHAFDNSDTNSYNQHVAWMDRIRETTWIRVSDPSEFLPSTEALRLHWYRCVWIANM